MNKLKFRFAEPKDTKLILTFIKELAVYENMLDEVVADEETLNKWLFETEKADVIIGEAENEPIGFALFFHNFSTFLGKSGIYLEDLYIREEYRKNGYGKGFLKKLAQIAKERDCGRLEWSCLDWNKPSIDFYLLLGAEPMDEWTVYRLTREKIDRLAK